MAGEAECQFNTNCWIRGRMVGMTGTFTGKFKADEVDAVSAINIRNGSVSSYIQYSRKRDPAVESKIRNLEWSIPAQPYGSEIDITIPIVLDFDSGSFDTPNPMWITVTIWRNGIVVAQSRITDYVVEAADREAGFAQMSSIRFIDFDVPRDQSVNYRCLVEDYPYPNYGGASKGGGQYRCWTRGKAMNAIRKR